MNTRTPPWSQNLNPIARVTYNLYEEGTWPWKVALSSRYIAVKRTSVSCERLLMVVTPTRLQRLPMTRSTSKDFFILSPRRVCVFVQHSSWFVSSIAARSLFRAHSTIALAMASFACGSPPDNIKGLLLSLAFSLIQLFSKGALVLAPHHFRWLTPITQRAATHTTFSKCISVPYKQAWYVLLRSDFYFR